MSIALFLDTGMSFQKKLRTMLKSTSAKIVVRN